MSIIGMIIHRDVACKDDNYYIMSADTRVVNRDNSRKILESSFESADKMIELTPNTLVGICGEYEVISLLKDIKEEIINSKSLFYNVEDINLFKAKVFRELKSRYRVQWSDTDLFFLFQDNKTNITQAWILKLPEGIDVELGEGLHLIGGDASLRASVKQKYIENFKMHEKSYLYTPNSYANQLLQLLKNIEDEDIGNDFMTYYIKPNGGIDRLNNFMIFKEESKIISMTKNGQKWNKSVNSVKIAEMTNDSNIINKKLRISYKSK